MPKRQRTDSEPPTEGAEANTTTVEGDTTTGTVAPPTKSQEVWFEDGNIILQAQNVQFKVYRAILSRRSQIFADALGIPQPAESEATSEGCPIVELPDSPGDLKHILLALHGDPAYTNVRAALPFPVIAALVRLGKKYDINHLRDEGLTRLKLRFPATLEQLDANLPGVGPYAVHIHCPDKTADDDMILNAVQLAHECGIEAILPALYYTLVQDMDNLFYYGTAHLPPYIVYTCLSGRDKLIRSWHNELYRWLGELGEIQNCMGKQKCRTTALQILQKVFITPLNSVLTTWEGLLQQLSIVGTNRNLAQGLCQAYGERAKASHWASRRGIWDSMPGYFGLSPWQELKDFAI